mmetsp:Transcript_20094/g.31036  ORF Transcript_20094/g.31036 Transcript_20094/m.31036 type:complete len:296 (+) Transcript_20094:282-1169(+)
MFGSKHSPVSSLKVWGFLCPCHESEDEFEARLALKELKDLQIKWRRTILEEQLEDDEDERSPQYEDKIYGTDDDRAETLIRKNISLDALLNIVDYPEEGPVLELVCFDTKRMDRTYNFEMQEGYETSRRTSKCLATEQECLVYSIPLHEIVRIDLTENRDHDEIHLLGRSPLVTKSPSKEGNIGDTVANTENVVNYDNMEVFCEEKKDDICDLHDMSSPSKVAEDPEADEYNCLLRFRIDTFSAEEVVEYLHAILMWDRIRREELRDWYERQAAMEQQWLLEKEILEDDATAGTL